MVDHKKKNIEKIGVTNDNQDKSAYYDAKLIQSELHRLRCTLKLNSTRFSFYKISKVAQHLLEGIHVDQEGLKTFKNLC